MAAICIDLMHIDYPFNVVSVIQIISESTVIICFFYAKCYLKVKIVQVDSLSSLVPLLFRIVLNRRMRFLQQQDEARGSEGQHNHHKNSRE